MSLNAIHENKILAKISEFTVVSFSNHPLYSSEEISFNQTFKNLKTYAAFSNAHLSRVCKRGKLSGAVFRPLTDSDKHSFPITLCHIGVPTFS